MRIISGKFRGKKLKTPATSNIRPTLDRVKEDIFNILKHRFGILFSNIIAIDMFAGTGALGIEALSRGAKQVTFIDSGKEAIRLIQDNTRTLGANINIIQQDITALKANPFDPFDLLFMDPPYKKVKIDNILENLHKNRWITSSTYLVIEQSKEEHTILPSPFTVLHSKEYTATRIMFIQICTKSAIL